jgi:hypothetical protein
MDVPSYVLKVPSGNAQNAGTEHRRTGRSTPRRSTPLSSAAVFTSELIAAHRVPALGGTPPRGSGMWVVGRLRKDARVRRRTPGSPIGLPDLGDCGGPREAPTRSRARRAEPVTPIPTPPASHSTGRCCRCRCGSWGTWPSPEPARSVPPVGDFVVDLGAIGERDVVDLRTEANRGVREQGGLVVAEPAFHARCRHERVAE